MSPLPRGRLKQSPEDFVVEEIPAYEPSGDGEHVFIRFTKRNITTDSAVRQIARALGASDRDAGVAGMKDKVAVTTQTISLLTPRGEKAAAFAERAAQVAIEGITIHSATRHGNKIKPGHLEGNRFTIVVRDIDPAHTDAALATLTRVGREGLPNAFGAQRFGRDRDNADRARAWLTGKAAPPRDPRLRRLLFSALQSEIFNAVLQARVEDGTWALPLEGDLLKRRSSGGLFLCADVQADRPRAVEGEVSPTGPILGVKMRWPEGAPAALEKRISGQILGEGFDLDATKSLGEGTRRALRLWVEELRVNREEREEPVVSAEQRASMKVYFVLPKGAYATTVLASAFSLDEPPPVDAADPSHSPRSASESDPLEP